MFSARGGDRTRFAWSLIVAGLAASGCSKGETGPERYDVAGVVTFQGAPVPFGEIQFVPDAMKGNSGPAGYAAIINGRFNTAEQGRGTVGGPHKIVIQGSADPPTLDEESASSQGPLFPQFHTTHELPREPATIDFQIPSAAAR